MEETPHGGVAESESHTVCDVKDIFCMEPVPYLSTPALELYT